MELGIGGATILGMAIATQQRATSAIGDLLRRWRRLRGMSQLDLALKAGISSRHVSFVENGRAVPSRSVVLQLAKSLEAPLRERNALLNAAGYADAFSEGRLDGPELEQAVEAIRLLLDKLEPYPAWVLDRLWNLRKMNRAAVRLLAVFLDAEQLALLGSPATLLRLALSPNRLRPYIGNWEELAPLMIARMRREASGPVPDEEAEALLEELLGLPDLQDSWQLPDPDERPALIPFQLRNADVNLEFITTVTTFGRPQDVLLQELWIETCFPANPETDRFLYGLERNATT